MESKVSNRLWTDLGISVNKYSPNKGDVLVILGTEEYPPGYDKIASTFPLTLNLVKNKVHEDVSLTSWEDVNFFVVPPLNQEHHGFTVMRRAIHARLSKLSHCYDDDKPYILVPPINMGVKTALIALFGELYWGSPQLIGDYRITKHSEDSSSYDDVQFPIKSLVDAIGNLLDGLTWDNDTVVIGDYSITKK